MPPSKRAARKHFEKQAKELGLKLIPGEDIFDLAARVELAWAEQDDDDDEDIEQAVQAINSALNALRGGALTQPAEGRDYLLKLADKADGALKRLTQEIEDDEW